MQHVVRPLFAIAVFTLCAGCEGEVPAQWESAEEHDASTSVDLGTDSADDVFEGETGSSVALDPELGFDFDTEPLAALPLPSHTRFALASMTSGKCLDVPNSSTANGVRLQQYPCKSGGNQFFYWELIGQSQVRIRTHSYKCLDVSDGTVRQRTCTGSASQRFVIEPTETPSWKGPHHVKIRLGSDTSKCLDVPGFSQANHQSIATFACNGGPNQRWLMMVNEYDA